MRVAILMSKTGMGRGDAERRHAGQQGAGEQQPVRGGDAAVGVGAPLHAFGIGGEVGVGRQCGVAHHVAGEDHPFAVVLDRDQDVFAVLGAEYAIGRDRGVREAHALRRYSEESEQRRREVLGET